MAKTRLMLTKNQELTPSLARFVWWTALVIAVLIGIVVITVWDVPSLLVTALIGLGFGAGLVDEYRS